ncbi:TonB-dependent receptor [Pedobacter sp. MC2016-14]|uniref:SusC/RagA family TonB-linked outer membrane protein n=1 Tax=Pedobacter sp. MC2016-14 TaxID=2897327 RepID=UPI001E32D989|nr:TonB-dependent receptor [Pedobacter sp. MC2016-14]MCD0487407.1 TonB-dependent receptor [Pedobacter sp. MC2016-14]
MRKNTLPSLLCLSILIIAGTTSKSFAQQDTIPKVTKKPDSVPAPTKPAAAAKDSSVTPVTPVATPAPTVQDSVKGTVFDATGPLPGVIVSVKGTDAKTGTDAQGRYRIAASGTSTLIFSFVGFSPKEEPVKNRKTVDILLQTQSKVLNEVQVVGTGYGTVNRSKLTSSVSSIGAGQIKNEVLPTISQAIQGKAGGVQVTQKSGSPGGGLNIRVRGTTSINASSDPLYVVDGIPVNSTTNFTGGSDFNFGGGTQGINILASINPSDVQSVEVLKDAASSSIYGARAANGVVLITTKKGQAGASTFSFNAYEGFSQVPNERKYKFMNTAEYQDYMRDFYQYMTDNAGNPTPMAPPASILANSNINTDWQNEIFRTAPTRNYELSASGGSDKTQYYTSVGYMRQGGVIQNSDFSRISARLNLDHQHSEKLRFSARINLTRALNDRVQEENSKEGSTKNGIAAPPNLPVYNADGSYALDQVTLNRENPIAMLLLPINKAETFRVLASTSAEYKFIPQLTLKTSFGADMSYIDETFFMPPNGIRGFASQGGIGAQRNTRDQLWINETTLTYDNVFGNHSLNVLAGGSLQGSKIIFVDARRSNFPSNDIEYISAGGTLTGANSYPEEWSIASAFSRVNYDYKGKYLLTATLRVDGSSRFGSNSRYGTFPSAGVAWRASDEDFLKTSKVISNLKFRASWGVTGNQNIPNYASFSLYSGSNNYLGNSGYIPNVLGDKNLKWETTEQKNFGLDLGLFNNRISILADYYIKNTSDLLVGIATPGSSGFLSRFTNVGEIQNKGFEFELTTKNLTGEFKWNTSFNMSFNRNKVISLPGGELYGGLGNLNIAREGLPLGTFYGWKMHGVNPQTGLIDYVKQDGSLGTPTDVADRVIIGNPNPDFYGGITNTFQYKNFDFSVMGQFSYGNDVFNYNLATGLGGSSLSSNGFTDWTRRWRNPGDVTDIPRPTPNSFDNSAVSDRFVEDGSFFRIRNITLGYTLGDKVAQSLKIKSLRIYATVQNAYVFTKYKGYDPEVSSNQGGANQGLIYGYDYGSYPQPRIMTAGVNLTF